MCGHGAKGKKHCEALTLVPAAHTPEWSTSGKASSQRLSHSIEPEPLSISVQGVMSGGGVEGLESSLCPTLQQSWSGGKQAMGVGSSSKPLLGGEGPPFLAGCGIGPLPGRVTSHISHLIPQLCIFWLPFLFLFVLLL